MPFKVRPILWKNKSLLILDQRLLPDKKQYLHCSSASQVTCAIRDMAVRGAPLIGDAAAFGMALAIGRTNGPPSSAIRSLEKAAANLKASRPTAINLAHAVDRMTATARDHLARGLDPRTLSKKLLQEAQAICQEDYRSNQSIARQGASLLPPRANVITYCNTGNLATYGYGTAAGIIYEAHKQGKIRMVYVCETRPYLQGSRLTLWEFQEEGVPAILITDNMAGHIMKTEKISAVIVGADRIARNGDTANKIGTYSLAVLARHHKVPFYVAAPTSTMDPNLASGREIPIEERPAEEVTRIAGKRIAPKGSHALHPAFDVTPAELIAAIITEKKVHKLSPLFRAL